jgi:hypothetical protein
MKTTSRLLTIFVVVAICVFVSRSGAQLAPPNSTNAALRYWMAFATLHDPPADQATAELLDRVASGTSPWDEAKLGTILDVNREALAMMHRASKLSWCDWGLEYELAHQTPIPHLAKGRVLGRLNGVAAARLESNGQVAQAVDAWIAGIRFSQHLAQGGTLISLLSARLALSPALKSLVRVAPQLDAAQREQVEAAVRAIPDAGFDWADAMKREADVLAAAKRLDSTINAPMPSQAPVDRAANEMRAERQAVLDAVAK